MQTLALDVYRAAHAIKGEAGILGLDAFRSEIHKFEEVFRHPLKNAAAFVLDSKAVETGSRRLRDLLEQAREGIAMLRKITRDRLSSSLSNHSGAKPSSTEPANDSPMVNLVRATEQLVADLCGKYRKQAKFVPHSGEIEIPTGHFAILRTVIHQLVRNSFVHGIEPPEERVTMGKNSMATIQFAARARDGMIEYVVQDDGRGVDTDRIAAKAGVKTEVDRAGLTELIFTPGLSTADGDGIDAGRGIGLDMVRDVIERAGGTIVVHDKPGAFCAFQFVIPRESK
jgi:two-component system chemotaxis sensor kinase CheA